MIASTVLTKLCLVGLAIVIDGPNIFWQLSNKMLAYHLSFDAASKKLLSLGP